MNRDRSIKLRLNAIEWEQLEKEAKKRDVPMSQILREGLKKELNLTIIQVSYLNKTK